METQRSMRLTAIEESILLWERASVPWRFVYEVAAPSLDPGRLRFAWRAALAGHEMGRQVLRRTDTGAEWVPMDGPPDVGPIDVVPCPTEAHVQQVRDALLDLPVPLDGSPLVRVAIARRASDALQLASFSHVMSDGIGGIRLLRSVGRAYAGVADPAPAVDLATARRTLAPLPAGVTGLAQRWAGGLRLATQTALPRNRVAPQGGSRPGFGSVACVLDAAALDRARFRLGASFDEHLLGALHVTIDRWNRARGAAAGRLGVAFGVNLRPASWALDVVANLAAFISVLSDAGQRTDLAEAIAAVRPQIAADVRLERARSVVESARLGSVLPIDLRARALAAAAPDRYDSIAISNLGAVPDPPTFVPGHPVELGVSPPAIPPVGLDLTVHTVGSAVRIDTGFRRERFDDDGARAFTDAFAACLLEG